VIEGIIWLTRVAERLPELGADGERLGRTLRAWLAPGERRSLDACAGLAPTARGVHWREIRDQALLDLADELAYRLPLLQQAQIVRSAIRRYASSRWAAVDRYRAAAPERNARLLWVLRANAGKVPSVAMLRLLISARAISNAAGHNGAEILFGTKMALSSLKPANVIELISETPTVSLAIGVLAVPISTLIPCIAVAGFAWGCTTPSRDMLVRGAAPAGATGTVFGFVYSGLDLV
jgi:hypothetical protein